ncbi:GlxA family transcriptional regulator [Massilia pseudoviolaceinigra]|uniref:GlxA family transcriptional regulator n=1 Tax=Massilia pseudoviolaceinigra TaxID=3057165 RepID=UPI002796C085|nr:DJ-1/PfpI family protein [Massilia sp. CCM 9206]MDQ1924345.1 DJ-1/PfpI family protein [Massilia sp. CCM 9206]
MPASTPRRIVFLAYEDMNLLDLAGPLQAFATANRLGQGEGAQLLYETVVASVSGGSVMSSAGLAVDTRALATLDGADIDTLIVAGGCKGEEFTVCPELVDWIGQHAAGARRLCSVCTGAFVLAAAGQLNARRVATHWAWVDRLRQRHPEVRVDADALFIQDGALWTSAGVTAGIDMSLALIEADHGHQIAIQTARQLVMFIKRAGGQSQFSVPLATQARDDGNFASLHSWIASHIDEDLGVSRLATMANMSLRTFVRVYTATVGRTPAKTVEAMRMEAACRALESSTLPLKAICTKIGYAEEQTLRRVFLRNFGVNPLQYRARFSERPGPARAT